MLVRYNKTHPSILSQGRNGCAQTTAIGLSEYSRTSLEIPPVYTLTPYTSKSAPQNCSIDIPVSDFWRLVEAMEKAGMRPAKEDQDD